MNTKNGNSLNENIDPVVLGL